MATEGTDWRLTNQNSYLQGAALTWKRYRAKSQTSEHEHCAFCWAKFMNPDFSETHRQHIAAHPDVLTHSYTTTASHEQGVNYHWVCKPCFDDFRRAVPVASRPTRRLTGPQVIPVQGSRRQRRLTSARFRWAILTIASGEFQQSLTAAAGLP